MHGNGSEKNMVSIRFAVSPAGVQQTLEPAKDFVLTMLRHDSHPEETLKSRAAAPIIYGAALEGDVKFFKQLGLLLRNHPQTKREGSFLSDSGGGAFGGGCQ